MSLIIKNYFFNLAYVIITTLTPLLTIPYLTKNLGPEKIGLVTFSISFMMYFSSASGLINPIYSMREFIKSKDKNTTFSKIFYINSIFKLLSFMIYLVLVFSLEKTRQNIFLFFIIGSQVVLEIFAIEWLYQSYEKYTKIIIRSFICKIISIIIIFCFIKSEKDYIWYSISIITAMGLPYFLNFILKDKDLPHLIKVKINKDDFFYYIKNSMYLFLISLVSGFIFNIDKLILGIIKGNLSLGYYSLSDKIVQLSLSVTTSLTNVLIPRLTYLVTTNQNEELNQKLSLVYKYLFFITVPMTFFLLILSEDIIGFFGGKEFNFSISSLRILSIQVILSTLVNFFNTQINIPFSKEITTFFSLIVSLVFSIIAMPILIILFNYNGAALCMILLNIIIIFINILSNFKVIKNFFLDPSIILYFFAGILMALSIYFSNLIIKNFLPEILLIFKLIILLIIGGIVYLTFLFFINDLIIRKILEILKNILSNLNYKKKYS